MPLNPNIALGVTPPQIQLADPNSGMNALARAMQIRGMQDESQVNALKMQELLRGVNETNALNDAYRNALSPDGSVDRPRLFSTLAEKNMGSRIPVLQKQFLEADTAGAKLGQTKAETQKTELEAGIQKAQHVASMMSLATDPQSYATVRAVVKSQLGQDLPEQFDPSVVEAIKAQGQTITERLQAEHQRLTLAETVRHNTTTETETGRHNTSTEGIQRGQLAVSQGQLGETRRHNTTMEGFRSGEVAQGKTQIVETPQGFVIVDKNTGVSRPAMGADGQPLKGKANDRVMTDSQAKANLFGTRMKESDRIITELDGKYNPGAVNARSAAADIPVVGGITGYAANLVASPQTQQAEQAQRDFINAVMRRESGATIMPAEFANAKQQYFPQPGDSKEVKAQKARNRRLAISGMEAEVPGGFRTSPTLTSPSTAGGGGANDVFSQADAILNGGR